MCSICNSFITMTYTIRAFLLHMCYKVYTIFKNYLSVLFMFCMFYLVNIDYLKIKIHIV